jgi:hypothetical protein
LAPEAAPSYHGPFDPDFQLEYLPADALARAVEEVCLQGHLLVHSFLLSCERRWGAEAAREIGVEQFTGIAGVAAMRLARLVGADVGAVLELHPAFLPRAYVAVAFEPIATGVRVSMGDCRALHENGGLSWAALLREDPRPLEALVQAVDPRTRVEPAGNLAWDVVVDPNVEPAKEPAAVTLTKFSTGADFVFTEVPRRRPAPAGGRGAPRASG